MAQKKMIKFSRQAIAKPFVAKAHNAKALRAIIKELAEAGKKPEEIAASASAIFQASVSVNSVNDIIKVFGFVPVQKPKQTIETLAVLKGLEKQALASKHVPLIKSVQAQKPSLAPSLPKSQFLQKVFPAKEKAAPEKPILFSSRLKENVLPLAEKPLQKTGAIVSQPKSKEALRRITASIDLVKKVKAALSDFEKNPLQENFAAFKAALIELKLANPTMYWVFARRFNDFVWDKGFDPKRFPLN